MSALQHSHEHRVAALARRCREELTAVADAPLWSLSATEAGDTLIMLTQARAQLDELLMRVLRHAETVESGLDTGATSTTNWWAHATRTTRAEAHRTARLAASLEHHDHVRTALAAGDLRTDQAGVIVAAVDGLPDDVADWVPAAATEFLLDKATEHDASALRVLGRRLLKVIDPPAADAEEARRLAAEEAHARAVASFTMTDDGHGTCHGRFTVPSLHGAMLRKHLSARAAATRRHSTPAAERVGDGRMPDGRFSRHQLGLAFMDHIESHPDDTIPSAGGVAATVVVTMDLGPCSVG